MAARLHPLPGHAQRPPCAKRVGAGRWTRSRAHTQAPGLQGPGRAIPPEGRRDTGDRGTEMACETSRKPGQSSSSACAKDCSCTGPGRPPLACFRSYSHLTDGHSEAQRGQSPLGSPAPGRVGIPARSFGHLPRGAPTGHPGVLVLLFFN